MALEHAQPGQVIDLFPDAGALPTEGSHALLKSTQLELIRLVLPAGKAVPEHVAAGEITLQCLQGALRVTLGADARELRAGQLMHLAAGTSYAIAGLEDAAALMSLVLRG
jgi:quercetin dioxygenase-like cupin family protein